MCHAGEIGGPESVREAVEILGAERIGHGIAVMHDPALAESLADAPRGARKLPLEQYLHGALWQSRPANPMAPLADHPLAKLMARAARDAIHRRSRDVSHGFADRIFARRCRSACRNSPAPAAGRAKFQRRFSAAHRQAPAAGRFSCGGKIGRACYNRAAPSRTGRKMKAHVWVMLKPRFSIPRDKPFSARLARLATRKCKACARAKFFVLELDGLSRAEAQTRSRAHRQRRAHQSRHRRIPLRSPRLNSHQPAAETRVQRNSGASFRSDIDSVHARLKNGGSMRENVVAAMRAGERSILDSGHVYRRQFSRNSSCESAGRRLRPSLS